MVMMLNLTATMTRYSMMISINRPKIQGFSIGLALILHSNRAIRIYTTCFLFSLLSSHCQLYLLMRHTEQEPISKSKIALFGCVYALRHSHQFSVLGRFLFFLGLTSNKQRINVSCSRHNTVTRASLALAQPFDPQSNALQTEPLRSASN